MSNADFWRVLGESRLLAPEQVTQLAADFREFKGAGEQASGKTIAEWLVARNVLSRYQSTILLAGRPGPFYYGDYKVYDRVESGRLAGQFRAVHAPTGHPVLLQFLTGPVVSDSRLWAAAANEAMTAGGIVSPHVQRYLEPVDLQSFKFLVSEDLRGETLDQRLAAGRFAPAETCRIVRLAAIGLAQMHQSGRIHGEVRLANVLLEPAPNSPGNVKLLFDASQPPAPVDFTQQQPGGRLMQMADYLAPELMHPGRAPDPLTDIYALGCTFYAMLAGHPPFAGGDIQHKLARHASEPIRPLELLGVPQPLAQLVAYMMAKNSTVRFQSAAMVAEQLGAYVDPAALYAQPPPPPATLATYEHYVRQKQARLVEAAPPTAPAPFAIRTTRQVSFPPSPQPSDREALPALGIAVKSSEKAQAFAVSRPAKPGPPPAEIARRREEDQRTKVVIGLLLAAVVVVAAIIGINLLPTSKPLAQNPGANGAQPGPVDAPGVTPANTTSSGTGNSPTVAPTVTPSVTPAVTPNPSLVMPTTNTTQTPETKTPTPPMPPPPAVAAETGLIQEVVADDGSSLWASPTTGKPVSYRGVPPEAQLFLIIRPADMLAAPEGGRVLEALGPTFAAQRGAWEKAAGVTLKEIELLVVSLHNNDAKFPRASFVVKTQSPIAREQLLAKWGNPAAVPEKSQTYYTGGGWAYYLSAAPEDERTFSMGEARDIKEVAAVGGGPPVWSREIERLRRATDDQRHFTLLFYPQFLFNDDGEPLFAGERARVRKPLEWLLGENLQAAAVSGQFGETFYFELRMLSSLDKEPLQLASELKGRLNQIPASLEDYFVMLNPPPYWRKLANRYPGMVRDLHGQMRIGVENGQAVANSVMPGAAAHNLVLGGELLVATTPGAAATVATNNPPAAGPKTIEEALQLKTSYSFDNQSLEFAMRDLAADVVANLKGASFEFGIKIIGPDLQSDGITRNQSIRDFKQENQTVADILTALVLKANPIPGKSAADKDQKLLWVVGPDPENATKRLVLITTRAAAANKKYTLPAPFVLK